MDEDKITLAIEGFNTRLLEIVNEAMLLGTGKMYAKQRVIELCNEAQSKLEELEANPTLIQQTIESLKLQFMRSWIMVVRELKKVQKNDELGVIGKTIQSMESVEPMQMQAKGIAVEIFDNDELGIAKANITNIRDFMTDGGLRSQGASERFDSYVDRVNEAMLNINEKLANGTLSTIGANGRRISVRNLSEIDARYKLITESLERATADGNKMLVASAHAGCSERCSFWQGKIFIDDLVGGISGRPMGQYKGGTPEQTIKGYIDGKPFYSLQQACENGFLSYNCQHRLIKYYRGVQPPQYDNRRVHLMRSLTERQRVLENRIRMYKRREALSVKGATVKRKNPFTQEVEEMNERKYNQLMSKYWQEQYKTLCEKNGLPEYRWRLKITEYEKR